MTSRDRALQYTKFESELFLSGPQHASSPSYIESTPITSFTGHLQRGEGRGEQNGESKSILNAGKVVDLFTGHLTLFGQVI